MTFKIVSTLLEADLHADEHRQSFSLRKMLFVTTRLVFSRQGSYHII